tara:strand:- start:3008 stop:3676 length:669 start_codon:yes stop_codon:yes gene_type:complete
VVSGVITILIADEHELVRTGIKRILSFETDFEVVAVAASGEQVVSCCQKLNPDVVLLDVSVQGIGAIETAKRLIRRFPGTKIVFISDSGQLALVSQLLDIGVHGVITKDVTIDIMVESVRRVTAGVRYLPQDVAQRLALSRYNSSVSETPFQALSERELNIALLLSKGTKSADIAKELSITAKTVNTYRYRMFEKLGIKTDVELVHLALFYKLIKVNQKLCA